MRRLFIKGAVVSALLIGSLQVGVSAKADFVDKCATYGVIPANDNPSKQHMNCLVTNAALEANIPPEVAKGVVTTENGPWQQFKSPGVPVVSYDNGIGLMQITDSSLSKENQERLKTDIVYNIQQGIRILNEKYNNSNLPKIEGATWQHIENWYFPVMAYNGIVQSNRPVYLATGEINTNAYQYKVFRNLEKESFLGQQKLAKWPFIIKDFPNDAIGKGFGFEKESYILTEALHPSVYSLKQGDQVELVVEGRMRAGASTTTTLMNTYKKGTILKIAGDFTYDETEASTNRFVWFPIKNELTQKLEYVSSANIQLASKKDLVAPTITKLDSIADNSTVIKGMTESYAVVTIQYGTAKQRVKADANGAFSIALTKKIAANTIVKINAIDLVGNIGAVKSIKVVDKTAPARAKVNKINDRVKNITGTAEANATVTAYIGTKAIGTAKATSKGAYTIKLAAAQKAGVKIALEVKDAAGNKSPRTTVIVEKLQPTVNAITSKAIYVTGKGVAGTTVYVQSTKQLGKTIVDSKGNYKVKIAAQKAGTKLTVYALDGANNKSALTTTTVALASPTIATLTTKSKVVTGTAEAGGTITVTAGNKKWSGKADSKGNYKVTITAQKKGAAVKVVLRNQAGYTSSATILVK